MKILCVFLDMIRPNRLATFNDLNRPYTPLDDFFKSLGGTYFTNCFTPGPDTPRSLSCFYTGRSSYENGCNTRLKWPRFFLKQDLNTVFDLFLEQNYKLDLFSSLNERETGFYPNHIHSMNIHNHDANLSKYLSQIELDENHFIFLSIPDFHWAFDDFGYSTYGEKKAYDEVQVSLDQVFSRFHENDFDHIFLFSDHGFKFAAEMKKQSSPFLLNEDRTNVLMLHRARGQKDLRQNKKLCSISDLYPTFENLLGKSPSRGFSLLAENERDYLISEDHINFTPELNQNIELWSLVNKNHLYIREIDQAILIDRSTRKVSYEEVTAYDEILKEQSSYGLYHDEFQKIFSYKKNIQDRTYYINGTKRNSTNPVLNRLHKLSDYIKITFSP